MESNFVFMKRLDTFLEENPSYKDKISPTIESLLEYCTYEPELSIIAGNIIIESLYYDEKFENFKNVINSNRVDKNYKEFLKNLELDSEIINLQKEFDYSLSYGSVITFMKSYSLKYHDKVLELPSQTLLRTAWNCGDNIIEYYKLLLKRQISHATPTIANSALVNNGISKTTCASCFLYRVSDNLESWMKIISHTAFASRSGGGIGVGISDVRSKNMWINGTGGTSNGIISLIKLLDSVRESINQGGRRPGATAIYLEPWHPDIFDFLAFVKHRDSEINKKSSTIQIALWVPDLFMKKLNQEINGEDVDWALIDPHKCPGLVDAYGRDFEILYERYYQHAERYVQPSKIFNEWVKSISQSGCYFCFKDNANHTSSLSSIKTITNSNLCSEITIPADDEEEGVCVLGAIPLLSFMKEEFDFTGLINAAYNLCIALDNMIDKNTYPSEEAKQSTLRNRPIGIGVMGLADIFAKMELEFGSEEAILMDKAIHSAIYYGAAKASIENPKGRFPNYSKSKFSSSMRTTYREHMIEKNRGILQPYLYFYKDNTNEDKLEFINMGITNKNEVLPEYFLEDDIRNDVFIAETKQYRLFKELEFTGIKMRDWLNLEYAAGKYGHRNCYVTAIMPTATTSNLIQQSPSIEPYTSLMYTKSNTAGEFTLFNQHYVDYCKKNGTWEQDRIKILQNKSSNIGHFKTAFEIDPVHLVNHAIARQPFISQSQSLNLFAPRINNQKMYECMYKAHKGRLTTGAYYVRSLPANSPLLFIEKNNCGENCSI